MIYLHKTYVYRRVYKEILKIKQNEHKFFNKFNNSKI